MLEDSNHDERCDRNNVYIKVHIVGLSAVGKLLVSSWVRYRELRG